jgi:hypothetical protein
MNSYGKGVFGRRMLLQKAGGLGVFGRRMLLQQAGGLGVFGRRMLLQQAGGLDSSPRLVIWVPLTAEPEIFVMLF